MEEVGTSLGSCCCGYCTVIACVLIEDVIDIEDNCGFVLDEAVVDSGVEQDAVFVHGICHITTVKPECGKERECPGLQFVFRGDISKKEVLEAFRRANPLRVRYPRRR